MARDLERQPFGRPPLAIQSSTTDMASSANPLQHDVHGKSLSLNLDSSIYGTLAEIGAGQEVARWFLVVGGASGTVAKTISAYDKMVSDDIYGAGTRYVSKERLLDMLDYEYKLLLERLSPARGKDTRFFVFADTVAARNYQGTNEQHGWLGIRFQTEPGSPPNQMLLHINLCDSTAQLQQQAIGILGVNLIYAVFHQRLAMETFLGGLFEELSMARIEIDVIDFTGPAFVDQDSRWWCLELLRREMAHAIVFDAGGQVVEPSSVLRKRPLLVMRGTFSHPERFDPTLFEAAGLRLLAEGISFEREPAKLLEMTIHHASLVENLAASDMLAHIQQLLPVGSVIVTDYPETYLLSRYLRRHSTEPVRFILSVAAAAKIMQEVFYRTLPGTLLEGIGRLLATNVKLYVAPMPREAFRAALADLSGSLMLKGSGDGMVSLNDLMPSVPILHLFEYLRASGRLVALEPHPDCAGGVSDGG
jgi:hypothetical protein